MNNQEENKRLFPVKVLLDHLEAKLITQVSRMPFLPISQLAMELNYGLLWGWKFLKSKLLWCEMGFCLHC